MEGGNEKEKKSVLNLYINFIPPCTYINISITILIHIILTYFLTLHAEMGTDSVNAEERTTRDCHEICMYVCMYV